MSGAEALRADPALARLWAGARERLEANGGRVGGATFTLAGATEEERRAAGLLLGRALRGRRLRIRLDELDRSLADSRLAAGLVAFLAGEAPLRDRPAERAADRAAEEEFWGEARRHPAGTRHPALGDWLDHLRQTGALREPAALPGTLSVLAGLPGPAVGRAVLAAEHFGDAHALDDGSAAGRLVLSALAALSGRPAPNRAADRKRLWEAFGVVPEGTGSTVLLLRLAPRPVGPVTRGAGELARAGIPFPVTLSMLLAEPWEWEGPGEVLVCENPAVLEAAARRRRGRPRPMACVCGMPSLAARHLLAGLRAAGADLRYHGDFGTGGIRIGNVIIGECGATPWRFSAADYREAAARLGRGRPLRGSVPDACWDPDLAPEMRARGIEIQEEQVMGELGL